MSDALILVSRVLMSTLFLVFGYLKFANVSAFLNLREVKQFTDIIAGGGSTPTWFGYLVAAIEVLGGIAILIGFKTRWVAWGLIAYLIIATFVGHPFWAMEGPPRFSYQFHFYKNLAIIAAYLMLIVTGPGAFSVDAKSGVATRP